MRIIASVLLFAALASAQAGKVFPGRHWETADPARAGWSVAKLDEARAYLGTLPPATVLVVDRGRLIVQWGDPAKRVKISSVRKSLLSALYGIYVDEGRIDVGKTLAQAGIDDEPVLTELEKKATVRMLLQSRSGIYHGAVAGTPSMRAATPVRGSHAPGAFWFYNNWDFNALGTVFEKQTGIGIAAAIRDRIAHPIGMEDYRVQDVYYQTAPPDAADFARSMHRAYPMRLTARDMARFGYLFLRQGNWNGKQIVPREWVAESTKSHAKVGKSRYTEAGPDNPWTGEGYAYCWWVDGFGLPVKSFSARGAMAKYIVVIPERELVLVYQNHAESPDDT